jgi:hypothetical protein
MMKTLSPIRLNSWREIAILMIIIMDVSWITPWFRSLTPETYAVDSVRILMIFSCTILFSHILIRSMDYLCLKKSIRQGILIAFLIGGCYIGIKTLVYAKESISFSELINRPIKSFADIKSLIPVEFIVIIAVIITFWRGVSLAQEHIGPGTVMSHFWIGIVMFVFFIFFITLVTGEDAGEFFYLFLFSTLVGVSAARMTVVGMVRGGTKNKFNRSWFLGILLAALVVVGISSLLGRVSINIFAGIGGLFSGMFVSMFILLWVIISPAITLLVTILSGLFQNSQFIQELGDSLQKLNAMMSGFGNKISDLFEKSGIGNLVLKWAPTLKTIILISVIVLFILGILLWMTIKLWRDRERRLVGDEEKSILRSGNILQSILNILLQRWNQTLNSLEQLTDFNKRQRIKAAARIRQVYAELMELCESLGQPRHNSITPLEFVPNLERIFPECLIEINLITQAYLDVRYGLLPENKNDLVVIESAWTKLHNCGEKRLKELKQNKKKAHGNQTHKPIP